MPNIKEMSKEELENEINRVEQLRQESDVTHEEISYLDTLYDEVAGRGWFLNANFELIDDLDQEGRGTEQKPNDTPRQVEILDN